MEGERKKQVLANMDKNCMIQAVAMLGMLVTSVILTNKMESIAAWETFFIETDSQKRKKRKKEESEAMPIMKNLFSFTGSPQLPLQYRDRFGRMTEDPNREYCKKLTHMYSWEILDLAELVKDDIEFARETDWRPNVRNPRNKKTKGRPPKYDYINRLLFVLEWLSDGEKLHKSEFEKGYAKSSVHEDKKHVLKAINRVLADEIRWPNAEERAILRALFPGIFEDVVGLLDITEHVIEKSSNPVIEHDTFSGKKQTNTNKTLSVIDFNGFYTWVDPIPPGDRTIETSGLRVIYT